jgi:protoporphyrinogen oxidase
MKNVLILGAGLAGVSAAAHCPVETEGLVLEKNPTPGGLLRTDRLEGFLFDHGPHLFFHKDPTFISEFETAVSAVGMELRPARTGQRSFGKVIDFPYSLHLKNLPNEIVAKCVSDFAEQQVLVATGRFEKPRNYEEHCRTYFGDGFTDHFMIPYALKIWTVHPRELSTGWVGERIILPDLKEVIRGALIDRNLSGNYIKDFRYPSKGGSQSFIDGLTTRIPPKIELALNEEISEISIQKKWVKTRSGRTIHYENVISTLPLPELAKLVIDLPAHVRDAISGLAWFSVLLLNFGCRSAHENPYQWLYFDQDDAIFHRIHYPSKLSPYMAPEGTTSIQAEISFSKSRQLPGSPDSMSEIAWQQLRSLKFVNDRTPQVSATRSIEYAYAIMNATRLSRVKCIRDYLNSHFFVTCGRFGEWDYIWSDKVLLSGINAVAQLQKAYK